MSGNIPIHVIANGELARQALNAVVTVLGTSTFATALKLSFLFAIIGTAINYIQGKNLAILAKWIFIYFVVNIIMLGPPAVNGRGGVTVQILDSSNPGRADLVVEHVPFGLAYPASIITCAAYGLVSSFEEAFHMPDDLQYNKTGMLFGSKLFRLSSEFQIINPTVKAQVSEYVKNCVLGDILISKKYSMAELTDSKNLAETITSKTSSIRGIYIGETFNTCREAGMMLSKNIEKDINDNGFKIFGRRIFGNVANPKARLAQAIESVYGHLGYDKLSNSALAIITQNLFINGVREGISTYTAETGATAALLNLSTTQAMERMRMSMATSRNIATYTIPIIHTTLLLLMLSLFPLIILLAFQPSFTVKVLTNYFYTLIWIESWPLMFACLNMVVTFYSKAQIGDAGLTLNNIDQLVLEHSDIANMAGYLMMAIPFISGGLVMGMASSFNTAASYIGGVLQSSSSSAATEAVTGNIHLGNSSWNNVNANKFDTNSSMMRGMATEQLETGLLRTTRPDGSNVYDGSHAISKLPVSVRASDMLSESFSSQAEAAKSASIQDQKSYDQNISSAVSDMNSFGESFDARKHHGEGLSSREARSAADSVSDMRNIATNVAKRNHVDVDDAFKGLTNFSQSGAASASISWSLPGKAIKPALSTLDGKASLEGKLGAEHIRTSDSSTRHGLGRSMDISAEEAARFSKDLHSVQEYSKTQHTEKSNSAAESQLFQLSSSLNKAQTASEHYSAHIAESDRLSRSAALVRQHSGQIDSDLNQEIADYAVKTRGQGTAETMFAGKDRAGLEAVAQEYLHSSGVENKILANYAQNSANINPDQKFNAGSEMTESKKSGIINQHNQDSKQLEPDAKTKHVELKEKANSTMFQEGKFEQINNQINHDGAKTKKDIDIRESRQNKNYNDMKNEINKDVKAGAEKATNSAFNPGSIKPDYAKDKKEESK